MEREHGGLLLPRLAASPHHQSRLKGGSPAKTQGIAGIITRKSRKEPSFGFVQCWKGCMGDIKV